LDIEEIDVFDSFQELGGDSILATHLLKAVLSQYPNTIDISDIYSYPSVLAMSQHITSLTAPKQKIVVPSDEDAYLRSLIETAENGDTIDTFINTLT
jgi:Phosphopantetheine attachment site